jgi:hypothetical protein
VVVEETLNNMKSIPVWNQNLRWYILISIPMMSFLAQAIPPSVSVGRFPHFKLRFIRQKDADGEHTGWLLSPTDSSARLMFVPPSAMLPDDANILAFPSSAVPPLDLSKAKLGERWIECHTPDPAVLRR